MKAEFEKMIAQLELKIDRNDLDVRLMHRIKNSMRNVDIETKKAVDDIVDGFDEKLEEDDTTSALWYMGRLLGLLEGFVLLAGTASTNESVDAVLPLFTLGESDRTRVLKLCADMRKIVLSTDAFDHPHKIRIANRIAAIEVQVHKEKGILDVILGGVVDVGETLKRFGKDIKPLTDRISEIRRITQENTPEYDQIPPPEEIKQIENKSKRDED